MQVSHDDIIEENEGKNYNLLPIFGLACVLCSHCLNVISPVEKFFII